MCASMDEGQHKGAKLFGMDVKPLLPAGSRVASVSRTGKNAEGHSLFSRALNTLKDHSAAFRQSAAAVAVGMVLLAGEHPMLPLQFLSLKPACKIFQTPVAVTQSHSVEQTMQEGWNDMPVVSC